MTLVIHITDFPEELFDSIWEAHLATAKKKNQTLTKTSVLKMNFHVINNLHPVGANDMISCAFGFNSAIQANKL